MVIFQLSLLLGSLSISLACFCHTKFVIVQGLKKVVLNGPKGGTFHLVINCLLTLLIKQLQITIPLPRAQEEEN
jgi:hypothetical protein